jgi:hypothetical protein
MALRLTNKRAGYGLLGTVIIIIVVLVVLGWFVR